MSGLSSRVEKLARRGRDDLRRRRLEAGESGWGAPVVPPPVLPADVGRPHRVAVVGAGRQGGRMAVAVTEIEGAELVGLADLDEQRRKELGLRVGLDSDRLFDDAGALFASLPIDLAIVATTAPSHVALGRLAAKAGIGRILLEKPIDNDFDSAGSFVEECRSGGVKLGVNYIRRWLPDHRAVAAAVDAGQIGPVRIITAQIGAGELAMLGSHYVDLCRMILGAEPVDVSARLYPRSGENQRGAEYEDPTGNLTVTFASGARAFIDFGEDVPRGDAVVTIRGDEGLIVVEENQEIWTLRARSGRTWTFPFAGIFRPAPIATRVVYGALAEGAMACTGEDAMVALEVVKAALMSSADGSRVVTLPLDAAQASLPTRFA